MKFKIGQTVFICSINLSNTDFKIYEDKITNIDFKNKKYVFNPTGLTDWYVSEEHVFYTKQKAINYGNSNIEHEETVINYF